MFVLTRNAEAGCLQFATEKYRNLLPKYRKIAAVSAGR